MRRPDRPENGGLVSPKCLEETPGAEYEHAAVPIARPGLDQGGGGGRIRLLHEALHDPARPARAGASARRDVAVTGVRARGRDAERHQPRGRFPNPRPDRPRKPFAVPDDVIGGHDEQHRVVLRAVARPGLQRRRGDGGRGVAHDRFRHNGARRHPDVPELLRHHGSVRVAAEHDGGVRIVQAPQP